MKKIIIPSKWSLGYHESRSDASKGIKKVQNSFHYPPTWLIKKYNNLMVTELKVAPSLIQAQAMFGAIYSAAKTKKYL